jgi:hypothetical protein
MPSIIRYAARSRTSKRPATPLNAKQAIPKIIPATPRMARDHQLATILTLTDLPFLKSLA